eukprot:1197488-Alexandrium_andersonii.AAC.1
MHKCEPEIGGEHGHEGGEQDFDRIERGIEGVEQVSVALAQARVARNELLGRTLDGRIPSSLPSQNSSKRVPKIGTKPLRSEP